MGRLWNSVCDAFRHMSEVTLLNLPNLRFCNTPQFRSPRSILGVRERCRLLTIR